MEKCSHRIHSPESFRQHIMAAKLIVVATALALCQATPALYNGFLYRDGRNFAISKAYSNNLGSQASGEVSVSDGSAQAYGSASGNQPALADLVYPTQANAQAELYNAPAVPVYGSAKAVAEAQNGGAIFYAPAPATIVSYEQNFVPAEISYAVPVAQSAQSTASINDGSDSSIASASSNGAGSATSSARTQGIGSYKTSSNANTYGSGFGSASSNANSGVGSAITAARTQGLSNGYSSAISQADGGLANRATADAQSNEGYGSASSTANNAQGSAISSAKTQGYTGSAASDASVNTGYDSAKAAAKVAPTPQKRIHWRFGTLYGTPSHINTRAQANANGFNAAKSTADVHQAGSAHSAANTYGSDGSANANANVNGGYGSANSEANTHGSGFAKSTANTQGYGSAQSQANTHGAGFGAAKSSANTGYGSANANADVNGAAGFAKSAANNGLGYGSAISSANTNGGSAHANARIN
ncbi:ice nucleation protein-like [Cydia pomonella]|uniref:ice nucleation protein-like n=1 Tax=Cydia pomonella TaxID=82600 RepID=UPI002ADE86F9|nr:ice nucleation protein-like [Cydia pomonella]